MKRREFNLSVSGAYGQPEKQKKNSGFDAHLIMARLEDLEAAFAASKSRFERPEIKMHPEDVALVKAFLTKHFVQLLSVFVSENPDLVKTEKITHILNGEEIGL